MMWAPLALLKLPVPVTDPCAELSRTGSRCWRTRRGQCWWQPLFWTQHWSPALLDGGWPSTEQNTDPQPSGFTEKMKYCKCSFLEGYLGLQMPLALISCFVLVLMHTGLKVEHESWFKACTSWVSILKGFFLVMHYLCWFSFFILMYHIWALKFTISLSLLDVL